MVRTAVIGAGMAGLAAARALAARGHAVSLFDKGRGPGGRASTRRIEVQGRTLRFDHGFQAVPDDGPHAALRAFAALEGGAAFAPWRPRPEHGQHTAGGLAGAGGANVPIRAMARGLDVTWGTWIETIRRSPEGFSLGVDTDDAAARGPFGRLVIAVPADQAGALLAGMPPTLAPTLAQAAASARMTPCWTLMAMMPDARPDWDATGPDGVFDLIVREASKPKRAGDAGAWVAQADAAWSAGHLEQTPEEIARLLGEALGRRLGAAPVMAVAHRWRFARTERAVGVTHLAQADIFVCGDWLLGPTLADAWCSGDAAGAAVAATIG
jgi:predicted NAD/FAD-dependent oxidoreductase